MNLYRDESSNPKWNAQRNLSGRTHYVDDDTLRFHKSRVLSTHVTDNGLIFALVESVALDMHNTTRGFRYVIFNVFGDSLERVSLDEAFKTRQAATKAMWAALNALDAKAATLAAINRQEEFHKWEMQKLRDDVQALGIKQAA